MDKNKLVVILAILTLLLFIFNIGSCVSAYNQNSSRKKEMFQRMELEEKTAKLAQENAVSAAQLQALQKQLDEETSNYQAAKKDLTQEQMIASSLKEDLQKLTKAKDALEEEFKKATLTTKKAKK